MKENIKIAIHQPDYLPYIGYFYKIYESDHFVFLDDAQYSNIGFTNQNRIKTPQGELKLKIPVKQTLGDKINEVITKNDLGWKEKHLKNLAMNYKRSKYFDEVYSDMEQLLDNDYEGISDLNIHVITYISKKLGISKEFTISSSLGITSKKEERVIDICTKLNGGCYLSGNGAKVYQVEEHFLDKGINLIYTEFKPVYYEQLWGDFIWNLSIVDYLFMYGYNWDYIKEWVKSHE